MFFLHLIMACLDDICSKLNEVKYFFSNFIFSVECMCVCVAFPH